MEQIIQNTSYFTLSCYFQIKSKNTFISKMILFCSFLSCSVAVLLRYFGKHFVHNCAKALHKYCILHNKTPHVVTVLWQDSDNVVTGQWQCGDNVEGYKTVCLCLLDSYTVIVCNRYLVSSHVVTVQLPSTGCLVDRFLHRPHGSGFPITCVRCSHFSVVTVSGTREQWLHCHSGSHCA